MDEYSTVRIREIYCSKSKKLKGKKIVLGVTGSIAVVEAVKLCRELIRHGANVYPVMTHSAQKIINSEALLFASGKTPILEIDGTAQHVSLCGEVKDRADLLLIAPCTANTISKIAMGIDDTSVTTFATTAIGSKIPVIIVPAMHISMFKHPILQENIEKLKGIGIDFVDPRLVEGKAKIAETDEIVSRVIRKIGKQDFVGKKVLVIAGSTTEPIDNVRILTNRSTGRTGIEIAKNAYYRGAKNVEIWIGQHNTNIPKYIPTKNFESTNDLAKMMKKMGQMFDIVIVPAAISDYTIKKQNGKIPSKQQEINLKLKPTTRILPLIRKKINGYIVGFKLESNISKEELIKRAYKRLKETGIDLIVANDIKNVSLDKNYVIMIDKKKNVTDVKGSKTMIAEKILDKIADDM